jgi:hypothetical protein
MDPSRDLALIRVHKGPESTGMERACSALIRTPVAVYHRCRIRARLASTPLRCRVGEWRAATSARSKELQLTQDRDDLSLQGRIFCLGDVRRFAHSKTALKCSAPRREAKAVRCHRRSPCRRLCGRRCPKCQLRAPVIVRGEQSAETLCRASNSDPTPLLGQAPGKDPRFGHSAVSENGTPRPF